MPQNCIIIIIIRVAVFFCLSPIYWQTVLVLMPSKTLVFHCFKIMILIKVGSHHANKVNHVITG